MDLQQELSMFSFNLLRKIVGLRNLVTNQELNSTTKFKYLYEIIELHNQKTSGLSKNFQQHFNLLTE